MTAAPSTTLRRFLLPGAVFAIAFTTFLPGLSGEFLNWDDDVNVLANPNFRGLGWDGLEALSAGRSADGRRR